MLKLILLSLACIMTLTSAASAETVPPIVKFCKAGAVGHVGREVAIAVQCSNPRSIVPENNLFELRNQHGQVLCQKAWLDPSRYMTFRFTVEPWMLGGHDLSVWLGDVCVSADGCYVALSDLNVKRITCLEPSVPAIAPTIVCGGGTPMQLDGILAVLEKYGVKATFFINGGYLTAYPEDAKRIIAAGHEIGSHGYLHEDMTQMTDIRRMRWIITAMNNACEETLGVRPRLFRAPFSYTNEKVTALCRAEGMEDVQWHIDSYDWSDTMKDSPGASSGA